MNEKKVSSRYAKAIYGLAKQNNQQDSILADFHLIVSTTEQSRDLKKLLESPIVDSNKKLDILKEIFSNSVSELTMHFLKLLTEKSRESLFEAIALEFEELYNIEHNKLPVTIYSAVSLDELAQNEIQQKLAAWTKKSIIPNYELDESIRGGLKVKINDWVFDASIQNQLKKLRKVLAG